MIKEKRILFEGNKVDRGEFKNNFLEILIDFLGGRISEHATFLQILNEIVKNIYDHAEGKGEATFVIKDNICQFIVRDFGTEKFDLEEIKRNGSTKVGNGINAGMGIVTGTIEEGAKMAGIELTVNTSQGFHYSGVYIL